MRGSQLEILFRPDVSVRDGRYANNGWLQELPRRFSSLTWDNAALISPELAKSAGFEQWRRRRANISRSETARTGVDSTWPGEEFRYASARVWA